MQIGGRGGEGELEHREASGSAGARIPEMSPSVAGYIDQVSITQPQQPARCEDADKCCEAVANEASRLASAGRPV